MKPITTILAEIPDLAREALDTWGTNPISDEDTSTRTVPGSTVLAGQARIQQLERELGIGDTQ